jgi:hypothetical protein
MKPVPTLSLLETRVLGTLVEKQHTVADAYPLTLNALVAGCNQKSSRSPVMEATQAEVQAALDSLKRANLVMETSGGRVARYSHNLERVLQVPSQSAALLTSLMLRGPQTAGEVRTRTVRLFEFADLAHVGVTLQSLMTLEAPLVAELPVRPGQKEVRYAQLLSGLPEPDFADAATDPIEATDAIEATDRADALEETVESLRSELADLRREFDEFRRQFQ